ncbi:MAG: type II toxin-antitoxin system RelE/ParE family toxin, partial [Acidobacteriia bacterium]|nr:type II toxin-antitoxin system RelE/ParE family toxin [Terriglobia bacterium]
YFGEWLQRQSSEVRACIQTRIDRVELGNFGDHKRVGRGVSELRIDFGPGCRIYYGSDGKELVILLAGGTKKRQARDIATVQACWRAYQQEKRKCQ